MKYCVKCGAVLPDETRFCSKCGAKAPETTKMNSPVSAKQMLNKRAIFIAVCAAAAVIVITCVLAFTSGADINDIADASAGTSVQPQQAAGGEAKDSSETVPEQTQPTVDEAALSLQGTYYQMLALKDTETGIPVADIVIPNGWEAKCGVNWSMVNDYPGYAVASATSPEGTAMLELFSSQGYWQATAGTTIPADNTVDTQIGYITYLDYRTADQMADLMMSMAYPNGYTFLEDVPINDQTQAAFDQRAGDAINTMAQLRTQQINDLGIRTTLDGTDWSLATRRYRTEGNGGTVWTEITTATLGFQFTMDGVAPMQQVYWIWPVSVMYTASSEEAFNQNYDAYEMFVVNGLIRPEFKYAVSRYRSYIDEMITSKALARAQAASEVVNGYMNDYDSSAGDTNDRVTEMWSDYIYDQDSYTTSDGDTVKVPTSYDYVYETDSGEIYATDSTLDVPSSWDELS